MGKLRLFDATIESVRMIVKAKDESSACMLAIEELQCMGYGSINGNDIKIRAVEPGPRVLAIEYE